MFDIVSRSRADVADRSRVIARSLWLPVGRANFYSYTANRWLVDQAGGSLAGATGTGMARSIALDDPKYIPLVQASVLRRLLEVLPRSFGYRRMAECTFAERIGSSTQDSDTGVLSRPVQVTLTLMVAEPDAAAAGSTELERAISPLRKAGIEKVALTVDEDGFYVLRAYGGHEERAVGLALDQHMKEILGGGFSLEWQFGQGRTGAEAKGSSHLAAERTPPVRAYNGLPEPKPGTSPAEFEPDTYYPVGVLTFFQLNTLFEGLYNDALTPAIFFEQTRLWRKHKDRQVGASGAASTPSRTKPQGANSVVESVGDVVTQILVDRDATEDPERRVVIRHFLAVTARESLQRFKWSVESVRRSLLDEMMGILHRQSPLVQLKLDKGGEWTPELAYGANESQLRGYVMLAGAKLPLIWNVYRTAKAVVDVLVDPSAHPTDPDLRDLVYRISEWRGLLDALEASVRGLETSVEHAWMERLLYEQEQVRAEQEAMAEIERVRSSRPASGQGFPSRPYNTVMLYVTILAAVAAVAAVQPSGGGSLDLRDFASWGPAVLVTLALLVVALLGQLLRGLVSSRKRSDSIGYEFAFRLDQVVNTGLVQQHTAASWRRRRALRREDKKEMRRLRQHARKPGDLVAATYNRLSGLHLDRRGGARIEYASRDNTVVKLHLIVSFRTARLPLGWLRRRARFEVINEFLARQVSERPQFYLRETRIFGDAPRPLRAEEIFALLTFVLTRGALVFQKKDDEENLRQPLTVESVLQRAGMLFLPRTQT